MEIMTACQRSGDGEKTFKTVQRRLPTRTMPELQERFHHLMEILTAQLEELQRAGEE